MLKAPWLAALIALAFLLALVACSETTPAPVETETAVAPTFPENSTMTMLNQSILLRDITEGKIPLTAGYRS